jgi:DNA-binding CsgD family transcriptional regulator
MSRSDEQQRDLVIGHQAERAALEGFVGAVAGGAAAMVLQGPPGIGKTALWSFGAGVAARAARVLTTRPGEFETKLSYAGLEDLLTGLDEEISRLAVPQRRALQRALRIADAGSELTDHSAVAIAATNTLRAAAADRLLVIAIDDLQWLDASSARVLGFALRRLRGEGIAVLATARAREAPSLLARALGHGHVTLLEVSPLTDAETDELIRVRLGAALPRALVREVHATAGGNPLFALELARAVLQHPHAVSTTDPLPVPRSLMELVGRRISALAAPTRETVLVVAMASRPTIETIDHALGRSSASAVQRAVDAGLIESDRGQLRFTHPLLAATAYADADPARRRRLHLRLAAAAKDVEERARQLAAGSDLAAADVATEVEAGAAAARARAAPEAAAALAERALRLTPDDDPAAVYRRSLTAADYLWEAGECTRSEVVLRELLTQLTPGIERAEVLRRQALTTSGLHSWTAAEQLLEHALREAGDDVTLRATLERDLAFVLMQTGDVRAATPHVAAAQDLARRTGDAQQQAEAETVRTMHEVLVGHPAPNELSRRLRRLAAPPEGNNRAPYRGTTLRSVMAAATLKWADDFDGARTILERLETQLWGREEDGLLMPVLFQLGELECWSGRLQQARSVADLARETCTRTALTGFRPMWLYVKALAEARAGRADEARATAAESLTVALQSGDARHQMRALAVLGFVEISTGNPAAAVELLGRVWSLERACGYGNPGVIRADADEIEAMLAVDQRDSAAERLALLQQQARRTHSRWATVTGLRCQGLLEAASGDWQSAEVTLRRAVALHARVADPLEKGRTLLALGTVLRRGKQRSAARDTLRSALELFGGMQAAVWAAKAAGELDRLAGHLKSAPGLTPMETQVAALVAAGRSNKEVARELYFSTKTVEAHLSSIYRKLGLRSRTELAAHILSADPVDKE